MPPFVKKLLFRAVRILIVTALLAGGILYFAQDHLLFLPSHLAPDYSFKFKSPFEEKIVNVDGEKIDSLLFKKTGSKYLILYFHGNAGDLSNWGEMAETLSERTGQSIWILDYPGYGKSDGHVHSENQLQRIAEVFMQMAVGMMNGPENVIIYGRSIGTGVAVNRASKVKPAALILESPYESMTSLVNSKLSWVPSFLLKYKLRSDEALPLVDAPILILHGREDEVIPFDQGERLSKTSPRVTFVPISGLHHNDLSSSPLYWQAVTEFVTKLK